MKIKNLKEDIQNYTFIYDTTSDGGDREVFTGTKDECLNKFFDTQKDIYNTGVSTDSIDEFGVYDPNGNTIEIGYGMDDFDFSIFEDGFGPNWENVTEKVDEPIVNIKRVRNNSLIYTLSNSKRISR